MIKSGYRRWLFQVAKEEIIAIPGRVIAILFFIFLLGLPIFTVQPHVLRIFTLAALFSIFASSWDLLAGFAGQVNLGHALFFGVAAYSTAMFSIYVGLPRWLTIPLGAICAVLVGLIAGLPALRLRGFYLSLVSLGLPVILLGIIYVFPNFTGGEMGLYGLDRLSSSPVYDYYLVIVIMIGSLVAMWKLTDARSKIIRVGVILHAIREDEITARASGIDTVRYKLLAFAISGFFSGIAGGIYAYYLRIAGPSTLDLFLSFEAIIWTIFGGITTIYGPVVGVFILYPLVEFFRLYTWGDQFRFIVLALILIITLNFMPEGIAVWIRDKIEVDCPRCRLINIITRRTCRACGTILQLEKMDGKEK